MSLSRLQSSTCRKQHTQICQFRELNSDNCFGRQVKVAAVRISNFVWQPSVSCSSSYYQSEILHLDYLLFTLLCISVHLFSEKAPCLGKLVLAGGCVYINKNTFLCHDILNQEPNLVTGISEQFSPCIVLTTSWLRITPVLILDRLYIQ